MSKKLTVFLLVALVLTCTICPSIASGLTKTKISLEQAIKIAKAAFSTINFPEKFEHSFAELKGKPQWQLRWTDPENSCEISISIDALAGHILSFNRWEYDPDAVYAPLPQLSQQEARQKAEDFLRRMAPQELAACRCQPVQELRPQLQDRHWPLLYRFNFQRFAHDIPFNYNGLQVEVNADTGDITNYRYTWTEGTPPPPAAVIGKDKAQELAQDASNMELQYYWPASKAGQQAEPILVYNSPNINNTVVDAFTGEVQHAYDVGYEANLGARKMANDELSLSPAEREAITQLEGLLTQTQALQLARQRLSIGEEYSLQDGRLYADGQYLNQRIWSFSFVRETESAQKDYAYANLNAKTGEIYYFSTSAGQSDTAADARLSREEAQAIAWAYIQELSPDKAQHVELTPSADPMPVPEQLDKKYLYYAFDYRRLVNGIPFPGNYFRVRVYAGQEPMVVDYSLRWVDDAKFPSKKGIVSLKAAQATLGQEYPFRLEYLTERQQDPIRPLAASDKNEGDIRLVYRQEPAPSTIFSAQDMRPLDRSGQPIQKEDIPLPQDIQGHWAEQDIIYLTQVGILQTPEDGQYRPDAATTIGEWLTVLAKATGMQDEAQARRLLLHKDIDRERQLTREDLAVYAVRVLGYEQVASLSNIFQLAAADAALVTPQHIGHVAIALELGLIKHDTNAFEPTAAVTRAETVYTLMHMLRMTR